MIHSRLGGGLLIGLFWLLGICVYAQEPAPENGTNPEQQQPAAEAIQGRYFYYGNPLAAYLPIAEIEVYSGGQNVVLGHPEYFTQDYLFEIFFADLRNAPQPSVSA